MPAAAPKMCLPCTSQPDCRILKRTAQTTQTCACRVLVTPMEGIKARLQVQYSTSGPAKYTGPIDCAAKVLKNEGLIRGLYRGWLPVCLCRMSNYAYFGSYCESHIVASPPPPPPLCVKMAPKQFGFEMCSSPSTGGSTGGRCCVKARLEFNIQRFRRISFLFQVRFHLVPSRGIHSWRWPVQHNTAQRSPLSK